MIALMLFAAMIQEAREAPTTEETTVTREQSSLSIPPEIAPAVIPYFQCVMSAMNKEAETAAIASADAARAAQQRALASCHSTRNAAKTAAVEMLSRSNINRDDREAFVERALVSIDHAHDHVADRLEQKPQG